MPRWSPCQAPPPPLFTSFVAVLHLGNDFAKTLASPGEGVDACSPTHGLQESSLAPSRTSLRCVSLRPSNFPALRFCGRISTQECPPNVLHLRALQFTHTPPTFSDRLRPRAVLGPLKMWQWISFAHSPLFPYAILTKTHLLPASLTGRQVRMCAVTENSTKGSKLV